MVFTSLDTKKGKYDLKALYEFKNMAFLSSVTVEDVGKKRFALISKQNSMEYDANSSRDKIEWVARLKETIASAKETQKIQVLYHLINLAQF